MKQSNIDIQVPLVVDLDGTLIHSDMLHESVLNGLSQNLTIPCKLPFSLCRGRAFLKRQLANAVSFDPATLPYSGDFLQWLRDEHSHGRRLVLCTASDEKIARRIADHLGIFDEVFASDGHTNLSGKTKAALLVHRYGMRGFDYAGNSVVDMPVWEKARKIIAVNASSRCLRLVRGLQEPYKVLPSRRIQFRNYVAAIRVHQWLKNILLFVPFLAGHVFSPDRFFALTAAFCSFSLCASAVYLINDLLDLENDRHHATKRFRTFAAGTLPVWQGIVLAPLFLFLSFGIAWFVGKLFFGVLALYFIITNFYSCYLKYILLLDCIALALLYTLRVIAGGIASGNILSFWLLGFSIFLFFSLAIVKRYAELSNKIAQGEERVCGRAYLKEDLPLLQCVGVSSGYCAVLVLALYLNGNTVQTLYSCPSILWGAIPVMLFWISRIWMQTHRGKMDEDPLLFAVKDKASLLCGLIFLLLFIIAAVI